MVRLGLLRGTRWKHDGTLDMAGSTLAHYQGSLRPAQLALRRASVIDEEREVCAMFPFDIDPPINISTLLGSGRQAGPAGNLAPSGSEITTVPAAQVIVVD